MRPSAGPGDKRRDKRRADCPSGGDTQHARTQPPGGRARRNLSPSLAGMADWHGGFRSAAHRVSDLVVHPRRPATSVVAGCRRGGGTERAIRAGVHDGRSSRRPPVSRTRMCTSRRSRTPCSCTSRLESAPASAFPPASCGSCCGGWNRCWRLPVVLRLLRTDGRQNRSWTAGEQSSPR